MTTIAPARPEALSAPVHIPKPRQPRWVWPALGALLVGTALLYLWNLSASGYANSFYAAAVQAGTKSWKALLFGSLDAGNAITVDKPPASLWIMGLSARMFGFSSWSLLAPQAVEGVLSVGLLFAAVRRWSGPAAGLLAGACLALTPAAALMFRFDNPDALLVLLLVAGAYCTVRAVEKASPRWLALAGVAIGFGFLTKMMQAFLVLPALGLVYLVAAPTNLRRRVLHLLGALGALVVSAGWFIALVELWPAGSRPYIGGSTNNSLLELALGYNGFSRLFGGSAGGGGAGGGGNTSTGFGGSTGLFRIFGQSLGGEISWLVPAALIALVGGLWYTRRAARTDRIQAALLLWGVWFLITGVVFSFMSGIFHPYYTIALAPAIGALVAVGGRQLWHHRDELGARVGLAAMVSATGLWNFVLLERASSWLPALRWAVLIGSALAGIGIIVGGHLAKRTATALVTAAIIIGLAGSSAWTVATASAAHSGSIPSSGPASVATSGMGGGGQGGPGGTMGGGLGKASSATQSSTGSSALTSLLKSTNNTWAAAVSGATTAADLELSSGKSVIALGGWNGSDPSPTLAQFKAYVASGEIHYFIVGGNGGGGGGGAAGGSSSVSAITSWVESTFTSTTVGGSTVYDLTSSTSS
jgi:4-amino-4-deoxy-L-arabinose transferase-like glycosyltransferase